MVVFGDKAHEVRNLPDDNAVGSCQAAGRCQVAAGVAGLQGRSCRCCTGADGAAAAQVGWVDVDEACRARYRQSGTFRYVNPYSSSETHSTGEAGFIYNAY